MSYIACPTGEPGGLSLQQALRVLVADKAHTMKLQHQAMINNDDGTYCTGCAGNDRRFVEREQ